jgi:hypothetical protein
MMENFEVTKYLIKLKNEQIESIFNNLLISSEHTQEIEEAIKKIALLEKEYAVLIQEAQEREEVKRRSDGVISWFTQANRNDYAPYTVERIR